MGSFTQVISFITNNLGFLTTIINVIETLAADLQNIHGVPKLDALAHAVLAAIESAFSALGANTTPPASASTTIEAAKQTVAAQAAQVQTI